MAAGAGAPLTFATALRAKYQPGSCDPAADSDCAVAADGQQAEQKKWEMVGMACVQRRMADLAELRSASLAGEGVAAAGDAADAAAAAPVVEVLDLSRSSFDGDGWAVAGSIAGALPRLRSLDISANPLGAVWAPMPGAPFARLRTLALNRTGTAWAHVAALSQGGGLAALEELRLDANGLRRLGGAQWEAGEGDSDGGDGSDGGAASPRAARLAAAGSPRGYARWRRPGAGAAAGAGGGDGGDDGPPAADLPSLALLSLASNALDSWADVIAVAEALPALADLGLSQNRLGAPSEDEAGRLAALPRLATLAFADNECGGRVWVPALARSEALRSLRVSASAAYGGCAAQHARLLLIAQMPRLAQLNASEVGARERTEAERFYLTRTVRELRDAHGLEGAHRDDGSDLPPEFTAANPHYAAYAQKHGNPSQAPAKATGGTAGSGTVALTLRGMGKTTLGKPDVCRSLPGSVKIGQLKQVIRASFGVTPQQQRLVYKNMQDDVPCPIDLESDVESLAYYSTGDVALIEIHDA